VKHNKQEIQRNKNTDTSKKARKLSYCVKERKNSRKYNQKQPESE